MYIVLKEEISNLEKDTYIYLSVCEKTLKDIEVFINSLNSKGVKYFLAIKNESNLNNEIHIELCKKNMEMSTHAILAVDDESLTKKQNYNFLVFETGYLYGLNKKTYLLNNGISNDVMKNVFYESPIREMQLSLYMNILKDIDNSQTYPKNLFSNDLYDMYAKERISYTRIIGMLDIRYKAIFDKVEKLRIIDENITIEAILNNLEKTLLTGARLLYFGGIHCSKMNWPYDEEKKELEIDFPVKSKLSRLIVSNYNKKDNYDLEEVLCTIKMEYIIPNNEVLGASFLPFFKVTGESLFTVKDIINILKCDGYDMDLKVEDNKIYFPIIVNEGLKTEGIRDSLVEKYGNVCNYIFPK